MTTSTANGEIKKLKVEMWNLKVQGTDVVSYNKHFQELALMCARMFPEESDKIEKRMLPNTSLILKLFCEKFKKLICHFTKMITCKLLVQLLVVCMAGERDISFLPACECAYVASLRNELHRSHIVSNPTLCNPVDSSRLCLQHVVQTLSLNLPIESNLSPPLVFDPYLAFYQFP
ncbi:hypothetical protein Tco_1534039 [Tanacetum coccineum]